MLLSSPWGLEVQAKIHKIPKNCEEVIKPPFQFAYYLDHELSVDQEIQYKACLTASSKKLDKYVIQNKVLIGTKKSSNKNKFDWDNILNLNLIELDLSLSQNKIKLFGYIKELEKSQSFWAQILKLQAYHSIGNSGRIEKIISDILITDPFKANYDIYVPTYLRGKLFALVTSAFKDFYYKSDDEKLKKLLTLYIRNNFHDKYAKPFLLVDEGPSLSLLRNMSSSLNYGLAFPHVIYPALRHRTNFNEAENYLQKSNISTLLSTPHGINHLWIFYEYPFVLKDLREIYLNRIQDLQQREDLYFKDLFFRLVENEALKENLTQRIKNFSRSSVSARRELYQQMINQGIGIDYALLRLFEMGDISKSNLDKFFMYEK
jgi:hypothetical protein